MSVFGTSLKRKDVFVHIMINMWYQFSKGPIYFLEKEEDFVFIFTKGKIDGSGTTTINLCLYSHD